LRLLLLLLLACGGKPAPDAPFAWALPEGFPAPDVPENNPMTTAKVELGRHLFYDTRLSIDEDMSCASCHMQELAFTDGKPFSIGTFGDPHPRGAMSIANVAYASRLTWANPHLNMLEDQALLPIFSDEPIEMGMADREAELVARLSSDRATRSRFREAFPETGDVSVQHTVQAIAAFERTILSGDSAYDRMLTGDETALTAQQNVGMELFFSERTECFHCHAGFSFSDSVDHAGTPTPEVAFHQTGLHNVDGKGAYPATNTGLHEVTGKAEDMGKFRAPGLRNVALTAPYMHDGSIETLDEVVRHYENGGRARSEATSEFLPGFILTDEERKALVAFLEGLTDEQLLTDKRFSAP
jgi:cytochrome c peroxidase